jgi:hypothetical protein
LNGPNPQCGFVVNQGGRGGNTSNYSVPIVTASTLDRNLLTAPGPTCGPGVGNFVTNATGGVGGYGPLVRFLVASDDPGVGGSGSIGDTAANKPPGNAVSLRVSSPPAFQQTAVAIFSPYPVNSPAFPAIRSGGGGGAGGRNPSVSSGTGGGGGGGGGGRGNAGNPGGCGGGGNPGSAANPTTFNCVPVTPGCTAPITVGSPGGQIVISWNPQ